MSDSEKLFRSGVGGGVLIQNQVLINFYLSVHVFKVGTYLR